MPITRDEFLKPISRDHHYGLLLCWKIRTGFKKQVDISRIKAYADWFYQNHLLPHFELEENFIFPILGNDHELVKKALFQHRELRRLFESEDDLPKSLGIIEEKLEAHIRFEERILLNEIQKTASPTVVEEMEAKHLANDASGKPDDWTDEFWK